MTGPRPRPAGYRAVEHTCPEIDKLRRIIMWHMVDGDAQARAMVHLETIRQQNIQLRENAAVYERRARGCER